MILLKVMLLIYSHISSPNSISRLNTFHYLQFRFVCISNMCCLNRKVNSFVCTQGWRVEWDRNVDLSMQIIVCFETFYSRTHICNLCIMKCLNFAVHIHYWQFTEFMPAHSWHVWPNSSDSGWGWCPLTSCYKLSNLQFSRRKAGDFLDWVSSFSFPRS